MNTENDPIPHQPQINPFYVGGAVSPDKFVSRRSYINAAFLDVIPNRTCMAIQGSNGMGKSSLLRYISSPEIWTKEGFDPSEVLIIFLNCFQIQPFTAIGFWETVLNSLKKEAKDRVVLQSAIAQILLQGTYSVNELRFLLAEIGKSNKFLLLLLDDFDAALYENISYTEDEMRSFLSQFRTLANDGQEKEYLSVIVTCLKRLSDMGPNLKSGTSPWHNHYLQRYLKSLKNQEVLQWFQELSEKHSIQWILNFQAGIQEVSGGNPALVQNAGSILYRAWRDRDIETVLDFAIEFERANRQYFSGAWNQSTDDEKSLLKFIALSRLEGRVNRKRQYTLDEVDIILSQKDRELRQLEERGILRRCDDDEKQVYEFASSIMEWWVVKELENSQNEPELADRELLFLNLSSKQIKQTQTIMKQVWQYKDTAQSVAGWVGKLGGTFFKGFLGNA
ncbi:ATP-binding protein [Nostoc sp.]|uniref:ATP-binding protein n=1 Tax=Nostoc sp. TaxID=1180 RepID=UPI002FF2A7FA